MDLKASFPTDVCQAVFADFITSYSKLIVESLIWCCHWGPCPGTTIKVNGPCTLVIYLPGLVFRTS